MQLPILLYGIVFFTLVTQTLHAKTHISHHVDHQELKKKLRIGYPKPYGYDELLHTEHNNITNETVVSGYCIDVFLAAVRGLAYDIDYEFIPFIDENGNSAGTYNDLVYQIYLQKFDAVVGDVTITANRSQYVDFTMAYTDIGIGTMAKSVDQNDLWIFLRPFKESLWLSSFAFFVFTGFVVWAIEHGTNRHFQGSPSQQIGTLLWFAFSTLFFAHGERLTNNLAKFVVTVWLFVVLILTASYTAILTSMLTMEQIQLTTLGGYIGTVGYHDGSFMQDVIVYNLNFQDYNLRSYNLPEEYANALSRGTKNGGATAIIDEMPYLKLFLAKYPDGYTLVKSTPITNGFGFAFSKGSPLVTDLSREIAKLRESGELMKIEDKWFKSKSTLVNQPDSVNNPKTPDLYTFRGLFLVTGVSSVLALVFFLFQRLFRCFIIKLVDRYIYIVLGNEFSECIEVTIRVDS